MQNHTTTPPSTAAPPLPPPPPTAAAKSPAGLPCPRCESTNTKFCYYNNYSLSQPRHFCKSCKRYWTRGGTLRNVPVGGGSRKNHSHKRLKPTQPKPSISVDPAHGALSSALTISPLPPSLLNISSSPFPFSSTAMLDLGFINECPLLFGSSNLPLLDLHELQLHQNLCENYLLQTQFPSLSFALSDHSNPLQYNLSTGGIGGNGLPDAPSLI